MTVTFTPENVYFFVAAALIILQVYQNYNINKIKKETNVTWASMSTLFFAMSTKITELETKIKELENGK